MNVLVTGATGFLGGHLVEACIEKGDHVRALVRKKPSEEFIRNYPEIESVLGDITDQESLLAACRDIEVVYHCAARSMYWGSWDQFYQVNELGTRHVVNACLENRVRRLVHVSSPSAVFDFSDQINIDESYPYPERFANHYCRTKAAAERLVLASHGTNGLSTIALRPHAIWGPRDWNGFLPQILSSILSGRFAKITDGKKTVLTDFCHVKNAVHACRLAGQSSIGGKAYFITDGIALDIWESLDAFCDALGIPRTKKTLYPSLAHAAGAIIDLLWQIPALADRYKPPITRYVAGLFTYSQTYTIDASRQDLGYAPQISFAEGLSGLAAWVDEVGGLHEFFKHT
jgi:2-alkyl-3-oxoalkanoate reductase